MEDCILECVKQAKRTGLTLDRPGKAILFFQAIRRKAQQSSFTGEPLAKALRQARQTALLLEEPQHTAPSIARDPKRLPEIIGVLLELSAARAVNEHGGKDEDGAVHGYAERTVGNWGLGSYELPGEWRDILRKLYELIPVWHGLKLAKEVDTVKADTALLAAVESRKKELEELVEGGVKRANEESNGRFVEDEFYMPLFRK